MAETGHTTATWRSAWQRELFKILETYRRFRARSALFFLSLASFFVLVNAICFWLALVTAFPELLSEQLARMLQIQLPVALLGGLFDSLSFFITVWLIRKAAGTNTGIKLIGILSVDLLIAAIATAWVLLVVIFSSWVIGPPDFTPIEQSETVTITNEPAPAVVDEITADETDVETAEEVTADEPDVETAEEVTADETQSESTDETQLQEDVAGFDAHASHYQDLLVNALQNPFENFRHISFGIIMGISTLLPTFFHVLMAIRSIFFTRTSRTSRISDTP